MTLFAWTREPRWRVAAFLAVAAALNYADRAAMSAVLSAVRTDLNISDVSLGLVGSVFLWSYALGSPIAGALADRFSRTKLVVGSLIAWSAVTALIGAATGLPALLALRFSLGVAECLFLPAAIALIADYHGPTTRARALSYISIGVNGGMIFGGALAGLLAEKYGWRSGFWVLGLGGIGLAFFAGKFLPASEHAHTLSPTRVREGQTRAPWVEAVAYLVRVPSYWVLIFESMLSGLGMWTFFGWLPLYFRETYNMSLAGAGFAGTFMLQVSVMLGIFFGGWISDRMARKSPARRMQLYGCFYLGSAPFLLLFLGRQEFAVVAIGISLFSFLRGLGQANDTPTQCEIVPPQFRSTGVGIMNSVATGAGGCGVLIAGFLKREVGLGGIFAGIAGVFFLAGLILLAGYRWAIRRDIARAQAMAKANDTPDTSDVTTAAEAQ